VKAQRRTDRRLLAYPRVMENGIWTKVRHDGGIK
jgi:hypothetical protein